MAKNNNDISTYSEIKRTKYPYFREKVLNGDIITDFTQNLRKGKIRRSDIKDGITKH